MTFESQVQSYFAALEADPHNMNALASLRDLYKERADWGELISAFHEQAQQSANAELQARYLFSASRLAKDGLRDTELASRLLELAQGAGQQTGVLYEIQLFAYELHEQWAELEGFFEQASEHVGDTRLKARLYTQLGDVFKNTLEDADQALAMYDYAGQLDTQNQVPLRRKQEIYESRGAADELVASLYQELELSQDDERKLELLIRMGQTYESAGQHDAAIQCYQSVHDALPMESRARAGLERLGQPVQAVEQEPAYGIDELSGDEAPLEGVEVPVSAGFSEEEASGVTPVDEDATMQHIPAMSADMVEEPPQTGATEEFVLSDIVEEQAEESAPVEVESVPEPPQAPPVHQTEEFVLSDMVEPEVEEVTPEIEPELEPEVISEVEVAPEEDVVEEPVEPEEILAVPPEEEGEEDVYEVFEEDFTPVDDYADEPEEDVSADAGSESWTAQFERNVELVKSDVSERERQIALHNAALLEWLHRSESAGLGLDLWSVAFEQGLGEYLYENFAFRYSGDEFWTGVLELAQEKEQPTRLQAEIALFYAHNQERAAELVAEGSLEDLAQLLEDREAAIDNWRKYQRSVEQRHPDLERDQKNLVVFTEMGKMARLLADDEKLLDALRRLDRVSEAPYIKGTLQLIYLETDKWPAYVDLVKQEAEALPEDMDEARIILFREAIRVYTGPMTHDMQAVSMYKRILEVDPTDMESIDALIELYEKNNRTTDQIALLQQKVDLARGKRAKVRILSDVAKTYLSKRNQAEAIKAYEQVLEIAPHDQEALEFLREMYEKRRDWTGLIDVFKRQIALMGSAQERLDGYKSAAQAASDNIRDPEPGIELWSEALKRAPQDMEVLGNLEALYEKKRDYEELATILERRVKLESSPDEKMKIYQKLGMLLSDRVQAPDRAIRAWQGALRLDPNDLKARKSLERLYMEHKRWDDLERLYASQGAYADLARVLETLVGASDSDEDKVELLLRSAALWQDRLDDLARAERALDRIHQQIDPTHEGAARGLLSIYEATENHEGLKKAYLIILEHQEDLAERRKVQVALRTLHEQKLGNIEEAFAWAGQIVQEDPSRVQDAAEFERLAGQIDAWFSVVEMYQDAMSKEDCDDALRLDLKMRLGRVLSEEQGNMEEALFVYQSILDDVPGHTDAMSAMASIYERQGRWDELMTIYQRRLELVDSAEERVVILHGTARIAEHQAGDKAKALSIYQESYELAPTHLPTLVELHRLYQELGDTANVAQMCREQIELIDAIALERAKERGSVSTTDVASLLPADAAMWGASRVEAPDLGEISSSLGEESSSSLGEESSSEDLDSETGEDEALKPLYLEDELERLIALNLELGEIAANEGSQPGEALIALGRVLVMDPDHVRALALVEPFLSHESAEVQVAACDICAPVYEVHGQWDSLVHVLRIKSGHASHTLKIELLSRIAQIYLEELGQPESSFEFYAQKLRLVPEDTDTRAQLHLLADALGDWPKLVALYKEIFAELDGEIWRDYAFALGQMYSDRVAAPDDAARMYYKVLEKNDSDVQALDALQDLFMRAEQWQDMLDVYDRKINLYQDDAQRVRGLRLELAGVWEVHLQDLGEAIEVIQRVLADHPEDQQALDILQHLQSERGDWEDVASTLMRKYELAEDAQKDALKIALGEVQEQRLDRPEMAATLYEEVLEKSPDSEDAVVALFRVMNSEGTPSDVTRHVALLLEPWFNQRERWQEMISALEAQARTAPSRDDKIELLHRVARHYEYQLGEPTRALGAYSLAFAEDVHHEETVSNMYRIAEQSIAWDSLVQVLEETVEQTEDSDAQRELLRRAASIYVDHIGDVDATANCLERVIELVPDDLESIEDLENIYRHLQDWEKLVGVLKSKANIMDDFEAKKTLLHQAGTIYEEVSERPQDAIEVYKDVLDLDPQDTLAIDRLEVLYTNDSNWIELLEVYKRKYELAEHDEARKDLLYVTGAIYQNELEDLPEAIDVYRRILDIDPMELGALEKLDELYEKSEQWIDLEQTLERELELTQVPNEQHHLKWRLGQLHELHLEDGARAVSIYQEVLQDNPAHELSLNTLADMIQRGDHELEAAEVLRPIYEASEQWEQLVEVQRLLLGSTEGAEGRVAILKEIASIQEGCLDDKAEAFTAYAEALSEVPGDEMILDQLERLAAELYAWDPYIDLLDQQIEFTDDVVAQSLMQRRVAQVYENQIQDSGAAIDRYNRVLEQDPMDELALPALDRLYMQEARWEELADVLERRIEQSTDPDERLAFRLRQGTLLRDALGDVQAALNTYQTILADEPEEPQTISALEEMFMAGQASEAISEILEPYYLARGEHHKLIEMYTQRLHGVTDADERHALLMQVARVYTEELVQEVDALQPLSAALYEKPDDEHIMEEMERIARAHDQWPTVAQTYMGVLEQVELEDEQKLAMWLRLANAIDIEMNMPADAETAYLNVLALDPGQPHTLAALDRIYESQQSWAELAEILERRVVETIEDDELVEFNTRLARLYRDQLAEPERAINCFQAVIDIDPGNLSALEELESLYYATQDFDALYRNLSRQADVTMDPDRQADLLSQQATLAEEALDRRDDAIELLQRVIDLQPDNKDAHQKLRLIYISEGRWADVVEVLEREITLTVEPEEQIAIYENMGIIWSDHLDDEVRALDAWSAALSIDPNHLNALVAMHDIYARRSDYHELATTLERMLDHPELEDGRRLEYWVEYSDVLGDMLQRPEEAIQAWRQVMMLDPGNTMAIDALERLYLQEGHWEEAVTVLDTRLDTITDPEHQLFVARQIAQLLDEQIGAPVRAASYHEMVLELDPQDENAYNALNTVYQDLGTPESYGSLVNLYLTHAEVVGDDAEARTQTLRQAAATFENSLGDQASSLLVLLSALTLDSLSDEDLIRDLERLADDTNLHGEVVQRYQGLLQEATDERDLFDLHRYAGRMLAGALEQPDDAIYHYQSAWRLDPENLDVLIKLEELYRRIAAWPELAQTLHACVELVIDPVEKIDVWRKLGEVYETQLADVDNAIASYEQILSIDETDLLAIESLERIYEAYGKWEMLIDILRQKVSTSFDPEESVQIRFRIATIYEQMLDDPQRAKGAYLDLLSVDEGHRDSLLALERLYTDSQEWSEALEVYDRQLSVTYEPDELVAIYGKIAYIHEEHFQRAPEAIDAYRKILEFDPSNESAIQNLERLYYNESQWPDLVDIVEQHIQLTEDSEGRATLLNELARVHRDQLQDPHSSIDAFVRSLDVMPVQPEPMRELALLYEDTDNWDAAVQVYERIAENSLDTQEQIELYDHIGAIFDMKLMDEVRSEQAYLSSLALNPAHVNAIEALRSIYERRGDWQAIIHIYKKAEGASRSLPDKASYLARVGRIYDDHLDDIVSALRYYEQAQELDPDVVEAAGPLIDVYMRERRYARALPLLEKLLDKLQADGDVAMEELHKRYLQMAQANESLDRLEPSLEAYHRAYEYNSSDRQTMMGLGRQLFKREDYEAAFKIYQNIQLQHLSELDGEEASEVFYNAGLIKQRVGDKPRAIEYFEKVLDYNPDHKESLSALLENYEAGGYWDRFIDLSRRLLELETDEKIKFAKLSQIGDIYAKEVHDPGMAMQTYLEALELQPQSVIVLRKLLDLYTKTRQWVEAIDMLERLIELEADAGKRAKFAYTVGVIYRDEVHSNSDAIKAFDVALDNDVHMLKAFEGIDRILTDNKDWKELERAYRRMLKRVAEFQHEEQMAALYMMLWKNLGEIYRSRLGHVKSAIKAFEMASELNPGDEQIHLILAQLYERSGEVGGSGVVKEHRALIKNNPFRIESYRALFKAYIQGKEYDKAWCMASALSFLQSATEQEQSFYTQYLGKNLNAAKATFNLELFSKLYHPDQDALTTHIMGQLSLVFAEPYSGDLRDMGINKKKDLLDPNDKLLFCKIYTYVAGRMAPVGLTPMPELYLRRDQALGMRNAKVIPTAFILGADMFQGKDDRELAFIIGKRLGWMLPGHYLGSCGYPTEWLKAFFMVALHLSNPSLGLDKQIGPNAADLIQAVQQADSRTPGLMLNLQKGARQYLAQGKNPNLSKWLTAVDHTTSRIGLLMCGDLHKAASCIKNDAIPVGKSSIKDKIRELVLFAISEEYFELRQQLGLAIGA